MSSGIRTVRPLETVFEPYRMMFRHLKRGSREGGGG